MLLTYLPYRKSWSFQVTYFFWSNNEFHSKNSPEKSWHTNTTKQSNPARKHKSTPQYQINRGTKTIPDNDINKSTKLKLTKNNRIEDNITIQQQKQQKNMNTTNLPP